jgi:hypothetical protein
MDLAFRTSAYRMHRAPREPSDDERANRMRLLVTGEAGFIGSAFVHAGARADEIDRSLRTSSTDQLAERSQR